MKRFIYKIRFFLLVAFCIAYCYYAKGQASSADPTTFPRIVPPAPEAASLGLFGQFQAGNYTGTVDISIPIFELKSRQISHKVSLAYNSSGVLIEENSPWVGANWSLLAGGLISRVVRGTSDDNIAKGLFYRPLPQVSYSEDIDNCSLDEYNRNYYDSEPDIYTFSFFGYSGKILFDKDLIPVTVPRQPLIINPKIDSNNKMITSWVVTDDKGFKYFFKTLSEKWVNANSDTGSKSWYLDKVISSDGQDSLSFAYDRYSSIYQQVFVSQSISEGAIGSYYLPPLTQNSNVIYEENVYIKNIKSSSGSIVFTSVGRPDNKIKNLRQLDLIEVYDKYSSTPIKKLKFEYNNTGERLFLKNIKDMSGNDTNGYKFEYIEDYLPDRFKTEAQAYPSYPIDYWGYYNGKSSNTHLIPYLFDGIRLFTPADRLPSLAYTQKGSLEKIIYPTGGYTKFYYELNKTKRRPTFYGGNIPFSEAYEIGGLRISKIENVDPLNSKSTTIKYEYPDQGYLTSIPVYGYIFSSNRQTNPCPDAGYLDVKTISSNSQAYLNSINGSHIYYPIVKEIYGKNGENGYSIYEYSPYSPDIKEFMFQPPFTPDDGSSSYRAGLLLSKTDYGTAGNRLKEIKNVYTISNDLRKMIRGLRVVKRVESYNNFIPESGCYQEKSYCSFDEFYSAFYNIVSEWQYKSSDTTRIYNPLDTTKYVETINTYNFDNTVHQQLSTQKTYNSKGQSIVTNYKYPADINTGNYLLMTALNMHNYPIEETTLVNGKVTTGKLTTYKANSSSYVPNKVYSFETATPLASTSFTSFNGTINDTHYGQTPEYSFDTYDNSNGNPLKVLGKNGIYTYYVWAYNKVYPVAKIESSVDVTIDITVDDTKLKKTAVYDDIQSDVAYLKGLFNSYLTNKDYQVTLYTYKPLVGMTSQTDPAERTTYYNYDDFGRLKLTKDLQGNIVKKMEYHYAGQ
jgi:YD repeat-containing protein